MSPAARHGRSGAFAFVDSQVATHRWRDEPTFEPVQCAYELRSKAAEQPGQSLVAGSLHGSNRIKPRPPRAAFACREPLVVIAVIAILPACFWSALPPAKARAHRVACLSNLGNLQLAWLACAHENNETLLPNAMGTDAGGRRKLSGAADRARDGARVRGQRPRRLILI